MSQYLDRTIEPPVSGFSQISIPYPELFILPNGVEIYAIDVEDSGQYAFYEREINKAVFLTREEAEKALER